MPPPPGHRPPAAADQAQGGGGAGDADPDPGGGRWRSLGRFRPPLPRPRPRSPGPAAGGTVDPLPQEPEEATEGLPSAPGWPVSARWVSAPGIYDDA
ncbi:rabphilin-3A-like [Panthera uncia]|uniref:rabphilin-3A-like n=1 Tax=Panthera uncia TaxID=29064 RepID=UPI0020FF8AE4|nr:rabphilin-3A-like [Panthera uncia]